MPIDLSEIANDPDLGEPFTIIRTRGQFGPGGWIANRPEEIPSFGVITVASSKELHQVAEGDRVTGALQVITATRLYQTSEAAGLVSDTIIWQGNKYQVQSVEPWRDFGFWSAILLRLTGS